MSPIFRLSSVVVILLAEAGPASAVGIYMDMPGIPGANGTPGHSDAINLQSLAIAPHAFTITKPLDSASPALSNAVAGGTIFPTATALFYNSLPPGAQPNASLPFSNPLASSYQVLNTTPQSEEVSFQSVNPVLIYLELPGIVGASSTPGHPGVMAVDLATITPGTFSIEKIVDSASPGIFNAVGAGTLFPSASLLFYNSSAPGASPDDVLVFQNVLASSYQVGGGVTPTEVDTFAYTSMTPEPSSLGLPLVGGGAMAMRRRSRR